MFKYQKYLDLISRLKGLSGYGFSHFLTVLQTFVLVAILTRTLSKNDFGIYSLFIVITTFILPVISVNFSSYLLKEYYHELKKNDIQDYLSHFLLINTLVLFFVLGVSYVFQSLIVNFLEIPSLTIFLLAALNSYFLGIIDLGKSLLRAQSKIKQYTLLHALIFITTLFLILLLYLTDNLTLEIIIIGIVILKVVITLYVLIKILRVRFVFRFDNAILRSILSFSLPLVLYSFTALIFAQNDRILIVKYLSGEVLAVYSAAFQLAFVISALGTVLQLAWSPFVFKHMPSPAEKPIIVKKYQTIVIIGIILFSLFYMLLYPIIYKWYYPPGYEEGLDFYFWFILGGMIQSIYWIKNPFLMVHKKNIYFFYITLLSSTFSLTFNFYMIKFGVEYLAISYFLSWVIQLSFLSLVIFNFDRSHSKT